MVTLKAVKSASQRIKQAKEHLDVVQKTCDSDVQTGLKNVHDKNQLIRSRLASIFGKFERALTDQGRAHADKGPQ